MDEPGYELGHLAPESAWSKFLMKNNTHRENSARIESVHLVKFHEVDTPTSLPEYHQPHGPIHPIPAKNPTVLISNTIDNQSLLFVPEDSIKTSHPCN